MSFYGDREGLDKNATFLIGGSPEFQAVIRAARIVASADVTVLIQGETGTGKELLALEIHRESPRASGPMITLNCAALPESLAESALFGHRRGSFTGAVENQPGLIQSADGGTLFLDELGELPLSIQSKLLRFLETGEYHPVGETSPRKSDARLISATNRDLHAEVKAGRFRADLYYRLNVVPLSVPPLRERKGDLKALIAHFIQRCARQHGLKAPVFSAETMEALYRHPWPGNVRELRNFCERCVVLYGGKTITPDNLPHEFQGAREGGSVAEGIFSLLDAGIGLADVEAQLIRQALAKAEGNRSRAARILGISRDTLLYRLKKHAITA